MPQGQYSLTEIQPEQPKAGMGQYKLAQTPSEVESQVTAKVPGAVNLSKTIASNLPSGSTLLAGAGGAAATYVTGSPTVGSGVMAGIQQLMDPKLTQQTPIQNVSDVAINTAINEILGRGLSGAGKVAREIYKPGSVLPQEMRDLLPFKPTAAQLTDSNVLNLIENIFSSKSKQAALLRSSGIADDTAQSMLRTFTGRPDIELHQPFKMGETIQKDIEQQFDASRLESNKRGLGAAFIAKANPELIPTFTKDPITGLTTPGQPFKVNGKIIPANLIKEAQTLWDTLHKSDIPPDPNSPIARALDSILGRNQHLDAGGNTVPKPRDFGDMWETKKAIDDIAYNNPKSQTTFTDTRFRKLSDAINKDIETSLPSWANNGDAALKLFKEAKTIVSQRNKVFGTAPIEKLVNEETKDIPAINSIIDDPKQLKKSLVAGNLVIPEGGTNQVTNIKYITNNTRKDLQGYELQRLINSAKSVDAKGNVLYDGQKLVDAFNDPNKQESYKLLYSAQNRADIEQFFKNVNATSQKGQVGPSRYWIMRMAANGLGLGAGLISAMGTGNVPASAGIVGGVVSMNALGRLLTNPATARLMVAAAQGGPLNMPTMVASRAIANILRNTPMTIEYDDGSKVNGKIDAAGKFGIPLNLSKD